MDRQRVLIQESVIYNMIHVIGDSHASDIYSGWKDCSNVKSHYLDSTLCYNIGMEGLKRLDIRKLPIGNEDILIFCYGEIDCRCHIKKHITSKVSYQKIIDVIIYRYFKVIKLNIKLSRLNLKVCVYNLPPPIRNDDSSERIVGTDEERKGYYLYFNRMLKIYCKKYKYLYFDVYDKYCDDEGFLKKELSDGRCHIYDGKYLQEFIDKNL